MKVGIQGEKRAAGKANREKDGQVCRADKNEKNSGLWKSNLSVPQGQLHFQGGGSYDRGKGNASKGGRLGGKNAR